jgi:hypothetical protein
VSDDRRLYGVCGKCWQSYRVKKDGTLRSHTNLDSHITGLPFSSHCNGSGTTPERTFWSNR